jgi:hypothetical protein
MSYILIRLGTLRKFYSQKCCNDDVAVLTTSLREVLNSSENITADVLKPIEDVIALKKEKLNQNSVLVQNN